MDVSNETMRRENIKAELSLDQLSLCEEKFLQSGIEYSGFW